VTKEKSFITSRAVDYGCSMSVMSYITFAVIAANTVINVNDVSESGLIRCLYYETFNGRK
jgi:hypothetical protein